MNASAAPGARTPEPAMDGGTLILIEMLLVFGGAIGFALWQVVKTNREIRADKEKAEREAREAEERRIY